MKKKILTALLLICFSKASCAPAKGDDGEWVLLSGDYGLLTIQIYLDAPGDPDEGVDIRVVVVPREDKDDRSYFENSMPLFYDRYARKVSLDLSVDGFNPERIREAFCLGQRCAVIATSKLLGRLNRPITNNSAFTVIQNAIQKARKKAQKKKKP